MLNLKLLKCQGGCLVCGNFSRGNAGGNIKKSIKINLLKTNCHYFPCSSCSLINDIHYFMVFLKIVSTIKGYIHHK